MKIGLLVSSMGNFGENGFYNAQEIGLAKELDKIVDEVIIYKLIAEDHNVIQKVVHGCVHSTLKMIPAKGLGINGFVNLSILESDLDALIYFSDTQLSVPKVYKWAKKHNIAFYPYIGVLRSHSTNRVKKLIIDLLFYRNISVYRNSHCFVKTPNVEKDLIKLGVQRVTVTPVGLDLNIMHTDYQKYRVEEQKKKYHYHTGEKILLFIGRFVEEKQPEQMIEIFKKVYQKNNSYRLLMVGTGELRSITQKKVAEFGLVEQVQYIDRIPYNDIWELYRIADTFVNLNKQEIFGMSIMEAMFYECKVVAWHAPGPDFIIKNKKYGFLCESVDEVVLSIMEGVIDGKESKQRILDHFTWKNSAEKITKVYNNEGNK